jgi:hypothetical protein
MTAEQAAAKLDRRVSEHIADWTKNSDETALQAAFRLFLLEPDEKFSKETKKKIRWAFRGLYNVAEASTVCREDLQAATLEDRKSARKVLSRLLVPEYQGHGLTDEELRTCKIVEALAGMLPLKPKKSLEKMLKDPTFKKALVDRLYGNMTDEDKAKNKNQAAEEAETANYIGDHVSDLARTYRRRFRPRPPAMPG